MSRIGQPWVWITVVLLSGGLLRLYGLAHRPMHTDEAVHAAKLGRLLDQGTYRYDPHEYHGPTLNILTWPIAMLRGQDRYADLDEVTLRLVPALCGLGLVVLPLACRQGLGRIATPLAMAFTAVSPGLVFYSRYYIQETLLVFFTFGLIVCAWRYAQGPRPVWAVLAGVCAGLMHATKETAVIAWACLAVAGVVTWIRPGRPRTAIRPAHAGWALLAAILVSALFHSCLLTHPRGILDSLGTLATYLDRAGSGIHIHPWSYYLDLLTWVRPWEGPHWNEDFLVVMAAVGAVAVLCRPVRTGHPGLARFLAVYTLAMTAAYSAIPYKTPWCMLGFLHGMALVAALFAADRIEACRARRIRAAWIAGVVALGVLLPLGQAWALNTLYDSDPRNPYVYAHTTRDLFTIGDRVRDAASVHPRGRALYVQVVCPDHDYWPLPWTLRAFPCVGYWPEVDLNAPPGDVILIQPTAEADLLRLLYEIPPPGSRPLYMPLVQRRTWLRPGVELRGYVRKDLWDAMPGAGG
ncbi:MAG: TIGR03663 family protein [Phycisphaerae bacterium]|nr:TIGR03663 family protein [Phycisphaerae bacterium]